MKLFHYVSTNFQKWVKKSFFFFFTLRKHETTELKKEKKVKGNLQRYLYNKEKISKTGSIILDENTGKKVRKKIENSGEILRVGLSRIFFKKNS